MPSKYLFEPPTKTKIAATRFREILKQEELEKAKRPRKGAILVKKFYLALYSDIVRGGLIYNLYFTLLWL